MLAFPFHRFRENAHLIYVARRIAHMLKTFFNVGNGGRHVTLLHQNTGTGSGAGSRCCAMEGRRAGPPAMTAARGLILSPPLVLLFFFAAASWADPGSLPQTPEVAAYWWAVGACTLAAGLGGILKCIEFFRDKTEYAERNHTHPELVGLESNVLLKLEMMRREIRDLFAVKLDEVDQRNEARATAIHNRVNAQVDVAANLKGRIEEHLAQHKRGKV